MEWCECGWADGWGSTLDAGWCERGCSAGWTFMPVGMGAVQMVATTSSSQFGHMGGEERRGAGVGGT